MVATVRSARNSVNPGEQKGLGVMIKTSQWTSDSLAPLCHTLHPHETELGCSLYQIFSVSKAMLSTPFSGLELNFSVLTLSASDAYLLPGRFCFEAVAGDTVQWQSICVSWIHSQRTTTHGKKKTTQTLLQGVFAACPHQVHVLGKDRDCSVVLLFFHEKPC